MARPLQPDNNTNTFGTPYDKNGYKISLAPGPSAAFAKLGVAGKYAVLAYSGITSASPNVVVAGGNIGSSSTPASATNFTFTAPSVIDNANSTAARTAGQAAYVYFTSLPMTSLSASSVDLSTAGISGGNSYLPGNYSAGTSMAMSTGIVFSAPGQYVFFAGSTVNQASGTDMSYSGSANASNVSVIWCVGSSFSQSGVAGVTIGTILAYASITFAGDVDLQGNALAVGGGDGDVTFAAAGTVTSGANVPQVLIVGGDMALWNDTLGVFLNENDPSIVRTPQPTLNN